MAALDYTRGGVIHEKLGAAGPWGGELLTRARPRPLPVQEYSGEPPETGPPRHTPASAPRGNGTPKDTDEFNRREVCKCDG